MNLVDQLRLRRLFTGMPGVEPFGIKTPMFPTPDIRNMPLNPPEDNTVYSSTTMGRNTPVMNMYEDYLKKGEPQYKDYEKGKVGKVLAVLAGAGAGLHGGARGGYETARGILRADYNEALDKHKRGAGNLKELAGLEYQTLDDNDKRLLAEKKSRLDEEKHILDVLKAQKDFQKTDVEIKNIANQMATRGLRLEKNEKDGQLYVVGLDGSSRSVGQFAESIGEKDTRTRNLFSFEEGERNKGRKELQRMAQAHGINLENLRTSNDKSIARLRSELDVKNSNMSPSQQKAAFDLALAKVAQDYPDLIKEVFDENGDLKANPNKDVYNMYTKTVAETQRNIMGKPPVDTANLGPSSRPGAAHRVSLPNENLTVQDPIREQAIAAIREAYPNQPELATDEESIAEAIAQLKAAIIPVQAPKGMDIRRPISNFGF